MSKDLSHKHKSPGIKDKIADAQPLMTKAQMRTNEENESAADAH
jgi:hypothetical protein